MRKLLCFISAAAASACLCCCNPADNYNALLSAPRPPEELTEIQQALEKNIKGDYSVEYPQKGEYLSSPLRYDLDGDGTYEAFVFYSTSNSDGTLTMHLAFLRKKKSEWNCGADMQNVSPGIDFVAFYDLDGNGICEVVAGWNSYNQTAGILSVYKFDGDKFTQCIKEEYLTYCVGDIDRDGRRELFVIGTPETANESAAALINGSATANAAIYRMSGGELLQTGTAETDPSIERYGEATFGEFDDGRYAVTVDGYVSGGGMLTETFAWEDSRLVNVFFDEQTSKSGATFRPANIPSFDNNGDGKLEIPIMTVLPSEGSSDEPSYFTEWSQYEGGKLKPVLSSVINPAEGYSVKVPTEWKGKLYGERGTDEGVRTFWLRPEDGAPIPVFAIKLSESAQWKKSDQNDAWLKLGTNNETVYAGRVYENGGHTFTAADLLSGFGLITAENTGGGGGK